MADSFYAVLESRGVLAVEGEDRTTFLQGLVSNDVNKAGPDRAIHAAFLTAQGKYLHDFFIAELDGGFLLDCEGARAADLLKRLTMYKLRSKVALADRSDDLVVIGIWGAGALAALGLSDEPGAARAFGGGVAFVDPRLSAMGARAVLPRDGVSAVMESAGLTEGDVEEWDALRMGLGLADGSRDMIVEKTVLLEAGFEELGGVDFEKGCYLGQEVTARTKYRGLLKKRLAPVDIEGPAPAPGAAITRDGSDMGEIRSVGNGVGLALLRLEALEDGGDLVSGEAKITPRKPDWMA